MRGVNRITLMGRVSEPEIKSVGQNNLTMARFGLVTEYHPQPAFSGPNKGKKKPPVVSWHNLTAWGKVADLVSQYVRKGDILYVEGRVEYNEVDDVRYTNITAEKIEFVGARKDDGDEDEYEEEAPRPRKAKKKARRPEPEYEEDEEEEEEPRPRKKAKPAPSPFDPDDDDLPF